MNKSDVKIETARESLARIQCELKAKKTQFNKFGNYSYRNCEDILEAVKPLLQGCTLTLEDEILVIGDRVYVKSTAVFVGIDSNEQIKTSAFAREPVEKKGMDVSQITGAASSYARKYALNGLLLTDDSKDADSQDNTQSTQQATAPTVDDKSWYSDAQFKKHEPLMVKDIAAGKTTETIIKSLRDQFKVSKAMAAKITALGAK